MTDIPLDLRVWDADECAAYTRQTKPHFLREVRHAAGFPPPLPRFGAARPRWSAKAVIAWALKS